MVHGAKWARANGDDLTKTGLRITDEQPNADGNPWQQSRSVELKKFIMCYWDLIALYEYTYTKQQLELRIFHWQQSSMMMLIDIMSTVAQCNNDSSDRYITLFSFNFNVLVHIQQNQSRSFTCLSCWKKRHNRTKNVLNIQTFYFCPLCYIGFFCLAWIPHHFLLQYFITNHHSHHPDRPIEINNREKYKKY